MLNIILSLYTITVGLIINKQTSKLLLGHLFLPPLNIIFSRVRCNLKKNAAMCADE